MRPGGPAAGLNPRARLRRTRDRARRLRGGVASRPGGLAVHSAIRASSSSPPLDERRWSRSCRGGRRRAMDASIEPVDVRLPERVSRRGRVHRSASPGAGASVRCTHPAVRSGLPRFSMLQAARTSSRLRLRRAASSSARNRSSSSSPSPRSERRRVSVVVPHDRSMEEGFLVGLLSGMGESRKSSARRLLVTLARPVKRR